VGFGNWDLRDLVMVVETNTCSHHVVSVDLHLRSNGVVQGVWLS
jgi:hypothetical protein